jgi:hypothetical protein
VHLQSLVHERIPGALPAQPRRVAEARTGCG